MFEGRGPMDFDSPALNIHTEAGAAPLKLELVPVKLSAKLSFSTIAAESVVCENRTERRLQGATSV